MSMVYNAYKKWSDSLGITPFTKTDFILWLLWYIFSAYLLDFRTTNEPFGIGTSVIVKYANRICTVFGLHEIILSGGNKSSVDITACVQAIESIVIKDLSLVTSSINSYGSLYITGDVNLDIKETVHESYEGNLFYSRIEAIDDIIIDLYEEGKITVSKYYDHDPIYSEGIIELKNNTVVNEPNGAYIVNSNDESYFVDKNGASINEITILAL